jgi:hypothetical protein
MSYEMSEQELVKEMRKVRCHKRENVRKNGKRYCEVTERGWGCVR